MWYPEIEKVMVNFEKTKEKGDSVDPPTPQTLAATSLGDSSFRKRLTGRSAVVGKLPFKKRRTQRCTVVVELSYAKMKKNSPLQTSPQPTDAIPQQV